MAFLTTTPTLPRHSQSRRAISPRSIPRATVKPTEPTKPTKPAKPAKPPPPPPPPRLSNLQVILERFTDTGLDAAIHYARLFTHKTLPTGPRVVILGTGWAAHSLVKVIDFNSISSVTVISPRNFFFFTPLLSATAVGTIEFRSIVEPIRKANPYIQYFEAFAIDVDTQTREVVCVAGQREGFPTGQHFRVPYDVLVVAVGETTATFGVTGARKYAYFLKEISDARRLRQKILDCLEKAALPTYTEEQRRDLLHFVVCGGGPTGKQPNNSNLTCIICTNRNPGCEFAGELSDFVSNDLAPRYGEHLVSLIRVSLLQSGKTLLTQFEESLQNLALEDFRDRINVVFNARVTEVTEHHVILQSGDRIPYGILIWAAGNGTRPIVGKLVERASGEPQDVAIAKRRKIPVDSWLRVSGLEHVFAVGDCAIVEGEPLPSTAQVAGQQGAFLGRLLSKVNLDDLDAPGAPILRDSGGQEIHPFRFLSLGIMAYLGNDRAIVQVEATKSRNIKLGGGLAYALWRSVYAVKQVDVRNRILVLFDYFKSRFFGRDISQF